MAEKKTKSKKVSTGDKHAITRVHITENVYSYEYTDKKKEKEKVKNDNSTD